MEDISSHEVIKGAWQRASIYRHIAYRRHEDRQRTASTSVLVSPFLKQQNKRTPKALCLRFLRRNNAFDVRMPLRRALSYTDGSYKQAHISC